MTGLELLEQLWEMSRVDGPDSVGTAALWEVWTSQYPTGRLRTDTPSRQGHSLAERMNLTPYSQWEDVDER